jgi:uncharacterized membrane protein
MKKSNLIWIFVIILIVVLLGAPRLMYGGRGSYMHSGYSMMGKGMMGYGMSGFVLLIPALLLVLVIAAGVWLGNQLSNRGHHQEITCPSCSKTVESDWLTCPHCSESLK